MYAVFFLLSVCALATVGGTLLGFFGGSRTLCIASNATAVGIAMLALATAHPRSSPSVREGWRFLSAAVLVGHGTVLAHTAGVMRARVAVCIALAAAPLAIRGLIRFEGSEARRGSWIAIVLETMSIGAAIAAVLSCHILSSSHLTRPVGVSSGNRTACRSRWPSSTELEELRIDNCVGSWRVRIMRSAQAHTQTEVLIIDHVDHK